MDTVKYVHHQGRISKRAAYIDVDFLVDTGATHSVAPQDIADKLNILPEGDITLTTGAGEVTYKYGTANITIFNITKEYKIIIAPTGKPVILGLDVLTATGSTVDLKHGKLQCLMAVNIKKRRYAMYAGILALVIVTPIIIKLAMIDGDVAALLYATLGALGGSFYVAFHPFLKKLQEVRDKTEASMSKGDNPPNLKTEMVYGISFNKYFYVYIAFSVLFAVAVTIYIVATKAVILNEPLTSIPINFGLASSTALLVKNFKIA